MHDEFLRFLLPGQRRGEWTPDAHIDLLPAFQQCYPGCMADDLLALQLFNPAGPAHIRWQLRVTRVGDEQTFQVAEEAHHYGDGHDYSDGPADEFPLELIRHYLKADRIESLQKVMALFKPAAYCMLCRVKASSQESIESKLYGEMDRSAAQHQDRADFLREVALELAAHLAGTANLPELVARQFRSEVAFGVRVPEGDARWLEIGAEAYQPSVLYEIARSDVASAAEQQFCALPAPVQLAVWFSTVANAEMPGGARLLEWEPAPGPRMTWKFWGLEDHFSGIAGEVMRQAADDYFKATERAACPDEDA